jgi:phosphomethylpyrimidine synthase
MNKARGDLDLKKQFNLAILPYNAKTTHASRIQKNKQTCTMCGDFCASRGAGKLFEGYLNGDKI